MKLLPLLAAVAACSGSGQDVSIAFVATAGIVPLDCAAEARGVGVSDMRFFVSEVDLIDADGSATRVRLTPDPDWQSEAVALVDLEDGSGACKNGTAAINATVRGRAPAGDYRGLRFVVGVPFEHNHADPLLAAAPLDDPAMHWHWRSGYKFLRAGVKTREDSFWIHLGSAGCEGTVGNITTCRFPNRVTVELAEFDPGADSVAFDVNALVVGTALDDEAGTDCSSGPAESSCAAPFAALGLDHATEAAEGQQTVFRVARP